MLIILIKNSRSYKLILDTYNKVQVEIEQVNKFRESRHLITNKIPDCKKNENNELHVIVIGESLNKNHMSLFGYDRETNPLLSNYNKQNLILQKQSIANNTYTIYSLSEALTSSNQFNKIKLEDSPSIINLINRSGHQSHWITNQQLYGAFDNLVTVIADDSNFIHATNYNFGTKDIKNNYDERVLDKLRNIISKRSKESSTFIIIHLMGSHVNYKNRYPSSFNYFNDYPLDYSNYGLFSSKEPKLISTVNH